MFDDLAVNSLLPEEVKQLFVSRPSFVSEH
jgi:hypothetical protein